MALSSIVIESTNALFQRELYIANSIFVHPGLNGIY